ncbi:MAG TPA: DNA alkylation repair protein, partial [Microlunatus sp.]|nr:DNA alkylation repair protein [Microlunatus sp.]
ILSQLGRRDRLDASVLASTIDPNVDDPEFFIRKAIGWALREYARVAPDWVREFASRRELSPLSRREALKHL